MVSLRSMLPCPAHSRESMQAAACSAQRHVPGLRELEAHLVHSDEVHAAHDHAHIAIDHPDLQRPACRGVGRQFKRALRASQQAMPLAQLSLTLRTQQLATSYSAIALLPLTSR